jgi:nicotinamidase-related amidase
MVTSKASLSLNPLSTALIMIDMQNDFAHPEGFYGRFGLPISGFNAAAVLNSITSMQKLLTAARGAGMFVVHTRIVRESFLNSGLRRHKVVPQSFDGASGRPVPLLAGSWGCDTIDELKPVDGEYILAKQGYSAFYGTPLEEVLRRQGIDTLVLAGTVTYACVLHTAFDAYVRDFDVVAASDGIASWVPDLQQPALRIMELLVGAVVPIDGIVASLELSQVT